MYSAFVKCALSVVVAAAAALKFSIHMDCHYFVVGNHVGVAHPKGLSTDSMDPNQALSYSSPRGW